MNTQKVGAYARIAASVLLVSALVLCLCAPALHSREAVPENPILEGEISEIRTLSLGENENGDRQENASGNPDSTDDNSPGNVPSQEPEQDEPDEPDEPDLPDDLQPEEPDDLEPEEPDAPDTPNLPENPGDEPSDDPGTTQPLPGSDGVSGTEGTPDGEEVPGGEDTLPADVDLGLLFTWYKYGSEKKQILCPGGSGVSQTILTTQLPDGELRYSVELSGWDALQAELTSLTLDGEEIALHGTAELLLGANNRRTDYDLRAEALYTRVLANGSVLEQTVSFRIVLRYEDGLDLELEFSWQQTDGEAEISCMPGRKGRATLSENQLEDGLLHYDFTLYGDSAEDAQLLEVNYSASHGEEGTMRTRGGVLPLQCMEEEEAVYTITALAEVNNGGTWQELEFTFVLTWKQTLDLHLSFTYLKNGIEAQTLLCAADERASAALSTGDLKQNLLQYQLELTGASAGQAAIVSVQYEDLSGTKSVNYPDGQVTISVPAGAAAEKATFTVNARCLASQDSFRNVTFTVTLRISGQMQLQMEYTLNDGEVRSVLCENGRSRTEEPIYDDQMQDGVLPFTLTLIGGEEGGEITSVQCYQSGSGKTVSLGSGNQMLSGEIALLPNADGSTGENTFTVTAQTAEGQKCSFSVNLPCKHRGEGTVYIELNVQDGQLVTNETELTLTVKAWSETADGTLLKNILANGQTVTLDGEVQRCTGSAGSLQQYTLIPKNPEVGDENEHILTITGEDDFGNFGEVTLHLPGQRTELGAVKGSASIYIDLSVLGLGITEVHEYQVLSGEPASYAVAKAVWDYDAGEPFGTAIDSFGWPEAYAAYNGSLDSQFYLTQLGDGSNMARKVNALSGDWDDYGRNQEEIFAFIDETYGENSPYAALWRSIYLRGYQMNPSQTYSVGEFDFTQASGWMYSIGGGTFYPGTALSGYELEDGDVLVLRYTLAYGSDIGGGQQGSDFCVTFLNGKGQINHDFQEETVEGHTRMVCQSCGKVQECPHENAFMQDCGDGSCAYYCPDCGKWVSQPEEHDWEITATDSLDCHLKTCRRCGAEEEENHGWLYQGCTATCAQDGEELYLCVDCGMERHEPALAQGHRPDLYADGAEHWEVCSVCGEEIEGSREAHSYEYDGYSWCCAVCFMYHEDVCDGQLIPIDDECDCSHEALQCTHCGLVFYQEEEGAFGDSYPHVFENGYCIFCGEPDPDFEEIPEEPDPEQPDPEEPDPNPEVPDPNPEEPDPEDPDPDPDPGTENQFPFLYDNQRKKRRNKENA